MYEFRVERFDDDMWRVHLPHQCDKWVVAASVEDEGCPHAEAVEQLQRFIAEATEALGRLKLRAFDEES